MLIMVAIFGIVLLVFGIYGMITETPEAYAKRMKRAEDRRKANARSREYFWLAVLMSFFRR